MASREDELAGGLGTIARALFTAGTVEETLVRIVHTARDTIDACDYAGLSLVAGARVTTQLATDPLVAEVDAAQYDTGEGPCLAVITEGLDSLYADDLRGDTRWPTFGPRAVAAGLRSLLAFRLFADDTLGALSLYARLPRAYGATDRAAGLIFAAHAGIALAAAQDRAQEARRAEHLAGGLVSREVIGQAQGILMEREGITAGQAFDVLCRASQHLNLKLRTVAQDLVDTGVRPEVGPDA